MGLFDMFKKKKERTLYDDLMDIPGFKEQKEPKGLQQVSPLL